MRFGSRLQLELLLRLPCDSDVPEVEVDDAFERLGRGGGIGHGKSHDADGCP